jgi:hypothetical protein
VNLRTKRTTRGALSQATRDVDITPSEVLTARRRAAKDVVLITTAGHRSGDRLKGDARNGDSGCWVTCWTAVFVVLLDVDSIAIRFKVSHSKMLEYKIGKKNNLLGDILDVDIAVSDIRDSRIIVASIRLDPATVLTVDDARVFKCDVVNSNTATDAAN